MAGDDDSTKLKFSIDDYEELKSTYEYLQAQVNELKRQVDSSQANHKPLAELGQLVSNSQEKSSKRKREDVDDKEEEEETKKPKKCHNVPSLPPEMWDKICSYSKLSELKNLRRVNSVLRRVASDNIKRNHSKTIIIKLCYNEKRKKFIHCINDPIHHRHKGRNKSLDDLIKLLVKCKNDYDNFPCSSFSFVSGNLDSAAHFFDKYGQLIKSLELRFDSGSMFNEPEVMTKKFTFIKLLRNPLLATTLESLTVTNVGGLQYPDREEETVTMFMEKSPLLLPVLRYFEFLGYQTLGTNALKCVTEIMTAAPHLDTCATPDVATSNYIQVFLDTNKVHSLRKFRMFIRDNHDVDPYEKLAQFSVQPQLESIDIEFTTGRIEKLPEICPRVSKALSKLLESSRRTLKTMKIKYAIGFLTDIIWPRFDSLCHLIIDFHRIRTPGVDKSILPPGFDWSESLPRLHTMTFIFSQYEVSNAVEDFPIGGQATSVKTLCVVRFAAFPSNWFQNLDSFLPNLEGLVIGGENDTLTVQDFASSCASKIWNNFKGLKSLKLTLTIRLESPQNPFLLDSVFTGLTKETCAVLRQFGHIFSKADLRVSPSILNLRELKTLDITFLKYYGEKFVLMSSISSQYAFKCLPNLDDVRLKLSLTKPLCVPVDLKRARRSRRAIDSCLNMRLLLP